MSQFDDYFTNEDKPFAENFNDALLVSNVFDYTVPINLPDMFSNSIWADNNNPRKAGVSIVTLVDADNLTVSDNNISGTGTLKLKLYPNFNSFGNIRSVGWEATGSVSCKITEVNGTTIVNNITNGATLNDSGLKSLKEYVLVFTLSSASLSEVSVVFENMTQTRYGANVKISTVDGLEDRLESIESKNTSQDTAISGKVDKETGKGLSTNDYDNTAKGKVDNLKTVATTGSYNDLSNKPTIPTKTSDLSNDGADGTNIFVSDNDSRLTNNRDPTSHAHGNITNDGKVGSTANKPLITTTGGAVTTGSFGTSANTFCQGNDSRLSDARTPTSHAHGNITNDGKIGSSSGKPIITTTNGKLTTGSFGTASGTFCQGNDSRLSDARTPTSHAHGNITNDGKIGSSQGKIITTGTNGVLQASDSISIGNISNFPETMPPSAHTHAYNDLTGKPSSFTPSSHTHGSLTNGGTLNSDISSVNKVAVTDSSNNLKTISKVPFANLNITKANITGLGIPETDTNTTYAAGTGLTLSDGAFAVNYGTSAGTACQGNDSRLTNARTPTSHAASGTTYGVSSASNYGHSKASATTPKMNGTAAVGSETGSFARGDHIHPSDTAKQDKSGLEWVHVERLSGVDIYYNDFLVICEITYTPPVTVTTGDKLIINSTDFLGNDTYGFLKPATRAATIDSGSVGLTIYVDPNGTMHTVSPQTFTTNPTLRGTIIWRRVV